MKEHGLTADENLMKESHKVDNSDLATVSAYLERVVKHPAKTGPTAVVAGSLGRAMALLRVAPLKKVRIPEDLSVVSIGTDETSGRKITGMLPDFDHMVDTCLAMLERQRKHGRSDYTGVDIRMHFVPGQTLHDLAGNGAATESAPELNHDPGTLSRVVHYREGANSK
jgi:DNA-binding LacI/PurR family transcriptional regulator